VLVVAAEAGAFVLLGTGKLQGPARNLVPVAVLGGLLALVVLAVHLLRYHAEAIRPIPARLGVVLLTAMALALTGLYLLRVRSLLMLPYDVGNWSEPIFILDIIKFRIGARLYLSPEDSNSNPYTFAAPALTYFLAWVLRHPASIPVYRLIQQFYLALAALLAAAATWQLVRLVAPERFSKLSRLWFVFFALASFLFATNSETTMFNVYLHNEPLALLASALAFWLMVRHAVTRDPRLLWAMTVMPALAFLVKQYLAIWAVVYIVYLWFDGSIPVRRVIAFATGCLLAIGMTIGLCLAVWGKHFLYWVFQVQSRFVISFSWLSAGFVGAGWYLALGFLAAWVLLRGQRLHRLLGIWVGWIVLVLAGIYLVGSAPYTIYLGSASMVAWSFFLAALAKCWLDEEAHAEPPMQRWVHVGLGFLFVMAVFAGLGHPGKPQWKISPDLSRYVQEIEGEFDGLPADRVLLDLGDWIYLRQNVLMKDRLPILVTPRDPRFGLMDRVRKQEYARILVHNMPDGGYLYDFGEDRGIRKGLLAHYREVRRINHVQGMESWPWASISLSDVSVLEPIPRVAHATGP
jgi:hypothetical protein